MMSYARCSASRGATFRFFRRMLGKAVRKKNVKMAPAPAMKP